MNIMENFIRTIRMFKNGGDELFSSKQKV
jgi:hypothetical protein